MRQEDEDWRKIPGNTKPMWMKIKFMTTAGKKYHDYAPIFAKVGVLTIGHGGSLCLCTALAVSCGLHLS